MLDNRGWKLLYAAVPHKVWRLLAAARGEVAPVNDRQRWELLERITGQVGTADWFAPDAGSGR